NLTPAEEGSIDTDILESIEIAGEWIFGKHNHVRDLADLERSISILVPGQAVAALRRHPQRLLSGQPTISALPLTVVVPARKRLPRRPQHRIGHSIGWKRNRPAAIQQAPDRDGLFAELVEAVAITRHPEKARHRRGDDAERLHAPDLRVARLIDVDDHPAAVADRPPFVDGPPGTQGIFPIAADPPHPPQ